MNKADELADVGSALRYGSERLEARTPNAGSESRFLLSFILQKPTSWLIAWPEHALTNEQKSSYAEVIERRQDGEPLAYITGQRDFWSLSLKVTPDTLIPRADTETLVEAALQLIAKENYSSVLDLGTGSGAIALAIASEHPGLELIGTDISEAALQVARRNLSESGFQKVRFLQSDWFSNLPPQKFDLIVSNPPYIAENDEHLDDIELKYEPVSALASGEDGLCAIRYLIPTARDWLSTNGHLALEHGYNQAPAVQTLFKESGYSHVQSLRDYAGQVRVTSGRR